MEIDNLIEIGTIVSAQGLQGELRVKTDSDFPERFEKPGERWLQIQPHQLPQSIELLKGKQVPGKNLFIIKLAGINDRNQAENLRGCKLYVSKDDRPKLDPGEYHVDDLINLQVFNQKNGENIGIVTNVFSAGNDILEVTLHRQPEFTPEVIADLSKITRGSKKRKLKRKKNKLLTVLIPFVEEIVPIINLKEKRIEINPPEGLLNLTDENQEV